MSVQQRRDTAAAWNTANPILAAGEIGIERDTGKSKTGNGSTRWKLLPYDGAALLREHMELGHYGVADGNTFTVNGVVLTGTVGRNIFKDSELSSGGGLLVGAAAGEYGINALTGNLRLWAATGLINVGNGAAAFSTAGCFLSAKTCIGAGSTAAMFEVNCAGSPSLLGLHVRSGTTQVGDLVNITNVGGTILSRFNKTGYFMTRKVAAPADADLATSELAFWLDDTVGAAKAMFKAKNSAGTVVTGSVALS